jgi:hypothetical protein
MQINGNRPTLSGMFLQHLIVFLICVVFPGGVTWIAPATWLTFERGEKGVVGTTRTGVFFVVPFKVQRLNPVVSIGQRERTGRTERKRKFGRTTNHTVEVDGEGFLQIQGVDDQFIEVSASPASLESVAAQPNDFLGSTKESSVTIFAIANWKFGGLMGGVLAMLTLQYVVGYTVGFLRWIATGAQRTFARADHP